MLRFWKHKSTYLVGGLILNFIESVWGARTRILVLLRRHYLLALDYICKQHRLRLDYSKPVLREPHVKWANCVQLAKPVTPKLLSPYPLYTIHIKPTPLHLMNITPMCLLNTGFHHTCMVKG